MVKKYLLRVILLCAVITLFLNKASAQYAQSGLADARLLRSIYWLTFGEVNANYNGNGNTGTTGSTLISAPTNYLPPSTAEVMGNDNVGPTIVGGTYVWQFSPTVRITANIGNISFPDPTHTRIRPHTPGVGQGSGTDRLNYLFNPASTYSLGSGGIPNVGIGSPYGASVIFTIKLNVSLKVGATAADTVSLPYPGMVIADAESMSSSASGEFFSATVPNTIKFQLLSKLFVPSNNYSNSNQPYIDADANNYKLIIENSGRKFTIKNTQPTDGSSPNGNYGITAVMYADGATELDNVTLQGEGSTAAAIGFILPFDLGDNPSSYGFTGNYIDKFASQTQFPADNAAGYSINITTPQAQLTPVASVFIGVPSSDPVTVPTVDADGQQLGNVYSSVDDSTGVSVNNVIVNDENGVNRPSIRNNQDGNIVFTLPSVTNIKNVAARLYAWVDLNKDGKYTQNEERDTVIAANTSARSYTFNYLNSLFKNTIKVGPTYARFRITTTALAALASTTDNTTVDPRSQNYAADGETEDYRLDVSGLSILGSVYDDGNGGKDNIISGTALSNPGGSTPLYAYLSNSQNNGILVSKATVAGDGSYIFNNVDNGLYTVAISSLNVTPNNTLTLSSVAATLPAGFVPSGASYGVHNGTRASNSIQTGTPNLQVSVVTPYTSNDVTGVNFGIDQLPVAHNDAGATAGQGTAVVINVLSNDTDNDSVIDSTKVLLIDPSDNTKKTTVTIANQGTYSVNTNTGKVTFTSSLSFGVGNSPSTINYTIKDAFGAESAPAQISVAYMEGVPGSPDSDTTPIGVAVTTNVRENDTDPTGTVTINGTTFGTSTAGGQLTVDPTTQNVTYTPPTGFTGKDTYYYQLNTNSGRSVPVKVTISVTPKGLPDAYSTTIGTPNANNDVFTNDATVTGTNTTIKVANITTPAHGTATLNPGTKIITYKPTGSYVGKDSYTYQLMTGDTVYSAAITVKITVKPVGVNDAYTTNIGVNSIDTVKKNDNASGLVPGIIVKVTSPTTAKGGTVTVGNTGIITYVPLAGFMGVDSYTYTLNTTDTVASNPVTVTIRVKPVGMDDLNYATAIGQPVVNSVKDNDAPSQNGTIVSVVTPPLHGTATPNSDKTAFTYQPDPSYAGPSDTYTYKLSIISNTDTVSSDPITVRIAISALGVSDRDSTVINTDKTTNVKSNDGSTFTNATVTVTSTTTAKGGTLSVDASNKVLYHPKNNFIGKDTYTYTLTNPGSNPTPPVTVTINVKPVGVTDPYTTPINTAITNPVKTNDGPSASGSTIIVQTQPVHGRVDTNSDTTFTYTPTTDYTGTDTYTYRLMTRDSVKSDPITVNINIVNPATNGLPDITGTPINTPFTYNVKVNDGDTFANATVTPTPTTTKGGTAVNDGANKVTYTPPVNFTGVDTYTYTLTNSGGTPTSPITVTVNVKPVGVNDLYSTAVGVPVINDVKLNDGPSGNGTALTVVTQTSHGSVSAPNSANTYFTYTPAAGYVGTDTYTYTLKTADGVVSDPITVTINIVTPGANGSNDADVTKINTPKVTNVKANDGTTFTNATVTPQGPTNKGGTVTNDGAGNVIYTPATGFTGKDTYTYTLTNSGGTPTPPITVTIAVKPVGLRDIYSTAVGVAVVNDVKTNDGASAVGTTVAVAALPAHGTVTPNTTNTSFTYTPATGYVGTDTYTYTLTTADGVVSDPITVIINIAAAGTNGTLAGGGTPDMDVTLMGVAKTTNVKANDGSNNTNATVTPQSTPTTKGGSVANDGSGNVTYTPASGFTGIDTYTYTLTNGSTISSPITVTINVRPVGADDTYFTGINIPVNNPVTTNDIGYTSTSTLKIVSPPVYGAVAPNGANAYTYTPATGFTGTDTYTYALVTADGVYSAPITVNVVVADQSLNGLPDITGTPINTPFTYNVKVNDGDTFANATVTPTPTTTKGGTAVNDGANKVTYTPPVNFTGVDTYTYTLTNSGGTPTSPITVTVNVKPVGVNDLYSTAVGVPVINDVKLNDGPSGNGTALTVVTQTSHGSVSAPNSANTYFTYTPAAGYVGTDTYTYTLKTADGVVSDPITVTINIVTPGANGSNDADVTKINTPKVTNVKANDGTTFTNATVTPQGPTNKGGTVTNDGAGNVIYTPATGFTGKDTYTYTLTNSGGTPTPPITVTIAVKPVGLRDIYSTAVGVAVVNDVKTNDGASAVGTTVAVAALPAHGTVTPNTTNTSFTYTPATGYVGTDTYTYTLTTADGVVSDPITVIINIAAAGTNGTLAGGGTPDMDVTLMGVAKTTNVKANDGSNNTNATVTPQSTPTTKGGSVANDGSGNVTYTPASGFTGIDTYTYTLTNGSTISSPITVTINVRPVGADDTYFTGINIPVNNPVTTNDIGYTSTSTLKIVSPPVYGAVAPNGANAYTYTPATGFTGTDTYTYALVTADGVYSAPITVNVVVATTLSSLTLTKAANNGVSAAGDIINYTLTVTNTSAAAVTNVKVADAGADAGSITPANIAVLASGASATVTAKHTVTAADVAAGFYSNQASVTATDINGNPVSKPKSDNPATPAIDDPTVVQILPKGTISLVKTGVSDFTSITFTFTITNTGTIPLTNISLTDALLNITNSPITVSGGLAAGAKTTVTFKYTLLQADRDAGKVINSATVNATDSNNNTVTNTSAVTVTVPPPPTTSPDPVSTQPGQPITFNPIKNDQTSGAAFVAIEILSQPKHGTLKVNADLSVTYTPDPGYSGPDTFTYRLRDVNGFYTNASAVAISDGFVNNLRIPNTFTPNGDGINDAFEILGIENYPINELIIVNRWGNEVYHKTNYTKEWTGEGLNEGTYYFLLHLKAADGSDIEVIKGYVSLIRNKVN